MLNKHLNLNCLIKAKYIISLDLHIKLFKAQEGTRDNYSNIYYIYTFRISFSL